MPTEQRASSSGLQANSGIQAVLDYTSRYPARDSLESSVGEAGRDRALDLLRGLAIVCMISTHVGSSAHLTTLLHLPAWSSAAEFFMLLSGIVFGTLTARKGVHASPIPLYKKLVRRLRQLLIIHYSLMALVVVIHELTGAFSGPSVAELGGPWGTVWQVLSLQYQSLHYMNILPMFIVLLLLAPCLMEAVRRGYSIHVLIVSGGVWCAAQRMPDLIPLPNPDYGALSFSIAAWQFLFCSGLVLGFQRGPILASLRTARGRIALWLIVLSTAPIMIFAQLQRATLRRFGFSLSPQLQWLAAKPTLGPLRLSLTLGLLCIGYFVANSMQAGGALEAWLPIERMEGVELLGRRSLRCFILHLAFALSAIALQTYSWNLWAQDLVVVLSVAAIFVLSRQPWVERLVPN